MQILLTTKVGLLLSTNAARALTRQETDEQDEYGSDFASTDEEEAAQEEAQGETAVQEEERRVRKVIFLCPQVIFRSRLD
jgi:K+/H+ antiporter YhaU regulatory subunit KhtT